MLQHVKHSFVGVAARVGAIAGGLQFDKGVDEVVHRCLCQWKSHGDVDVFNVCRERVKHWQEKGFITKNNGVFFQVLCSVNALTPLRNEACLCILGGRGDILYFFVAPQGVENRFG